MKRKISTLLLLAFGVFLVTGFYSCGPPPLPASTSGGGFLIQTEFTSFTGPLITIVPNVTTHWTWKQDVQGLFAAGDASSFSNTTNSLGLGESLNGRVTSIWDVQWLAGGPPNCIGAPDEPGAQFQSNPQRVTEVICTQIQGFDQIVGQGDFVFIPRPIYTDGSSGTTATIRGSGFSAQYGMPLVQYYDPSGTLVSQANVTSVAPDGTWASAAMPDVSQVQVGSYSGVIYNANASGGYDFLGVAAVTVLDPADPGTGGCTGSPRPLNCN